MWGCNALVSFGCLTLSYNWEWCFISKHKNNKQIIGFDILNKKSNENDINRAATTWAKTHEKVDEEMEKKY